MKHAVNVLLPIVVLAVVFLLKESSSLADDLPEDTNKIESITLEYARRLAERVPKEVRVRVEGFGTFVHKSCLSLDGLKALDAETAKALAGCNTDAILLNGLTALDADTAKALAACKAEALYLNGLTTIDTESARGLADFAGHSLLLNGATTLDAEAAESLAGFKGERIFLSGLQTLSAEAAEAIAAFRGRSLDLRMNALDSSVAEGLAEFKGQLTIRGVTVLEVDAADSIAEHEGSLDFVDLKSLSPEVAKALADCNGASLSLRAVTTLNAAAAEAVADFKGGLFLDGLSTLDADAVKALAEFKGEMLVIDGFLETIGDATPLTAETARLVCVCANGGDSYVILPGVTTLESPESAEISRIFATCEGPLSLPNLRTISPQSLAALGKHDRIDMPSLRSVSSAEPVDNPVKKQLQSESYAVTWEAAPAFDAEAVLEIGDGNGHGGTLGWVRFQPGKHGVEVLSIQFDKGWHPYKSKWPPDRAPVVVTSANMMPDRYALLLADLAVVDSAKLQPVERNGFISASSSNDFWVYARLTTDKDTLLDLNWAGYEGSRGELKFAKPRAAVRLAREAVRGLNFKDHSLTDGERSWASEKFARDWNGLDLDWWVRERYIQTIGVVGDEAVLPLLREVLATEPLQGKPRESSDGRRVYYAINAVTALMKKDVRDRPIEEMDIEAVRLKVLDLIDEKK